MAWKRWHRSAKDISFATSRRRSAEEPVDKKTHINIAYAFAAFIAILLFQGWLATRQQVETVSFSEFEQLLKDGKIEAVNVRGNFLDGKLKKPLPDGRQLYSTVLVAPEIFDMLDKYKVKITGVVQSHFISDLLSWV